MKKQSLTMQCLLAVAFLAASQPVMAGWKLMPGGKPVAVDQIQVTPVTDWNQASSRPGKQGRVWTRDGLDLNALELFSAIGPGQPIYRERSKKHNPMPRFDDRLLLPELADLFERSFRTSNDISDFEVVESTPTMISGSRGISVRYRYTKPNDELVRLGIVRLAVVRGKLFMLNFHAPRLHYFEAGLPEATAMMDSARL